VAVRLDPGRQDGPRAVLAIFAMKSSRSGFISDDTCPPFRVEQPQPISPASQTTTCRPPRARCSAVCRPVKPDPTTSTSSRGSTVAAGTGGRAISARHKGVSL
jgi:hypothetical protein